MNKPILKVQGLTVEFKTRKGVVRAVDGVDFHLQECETLGVVGESGCGKTVMALSILRLVPRPQGRIVAGNIWFQDKDLVRAGEKEVRRIRGNSIAMIFQDPMSSLNPVLKLGFQIEETLHLHRRLKGREATKTALELLKQVGIPDAKAHYSNYPHQLSGGMRQRVMIAIALSCRPQIMIADEPTTALDVTIQAQVLELIKQLKEEIGMSVILITHNMGVVAEMAQKVVVIYTGKVVEMAEVEDLFEYPLHPYTYGLLESLPRARNNCSRLKPIPGIVPNLFKLPAGCSFQDRCSQIQTPCYSKDPPWVEFRKNHWVRCFNPRSEKL